jgi:hypothetical protein
MKVKIFIHLSDSVIQLDIEEDIKIIELKKYIIKKYTEDDCKYIDLENINEKVVKNFGKMYLERGNIPRIFDNFNLSKFMMDDGEINLKIKKVDDYEHQDNASNTVNKQGNQTVKKAYIPPSKRDEIPKEFNYFEEDFPPLS